MHMKLFSDNHCHAKSLSVDPNDTARAQQIDTFLMLEEMKWHLKDHSQAESP